MNHSLPTTSLFLNLLLGQTQSIHEANENEEQGQMEVGLLLSIDHPLAERSVQEQMNQCGADAC